jgi:hypothetical protein
MKAATGWALAALLLAVACGGAAPVAKVEEKASKASTQLLWQSEHDNYPCADPCGLGGSCNCVGANNCPSGAINGSPCSSAGAECQAPVDGAHFTDVVCELVTVADPPPPQPTWHVTSRSSCADCPRGTCSSCGLATCAISSLGQACGSAGATCVAIAGSQLDTLTCE